MKAFCSKTMFGRVDECNAASLLGQSSGSQLLVDISVIYKRDARTGIQRVVRGILLQLLQHGASGYVVRPVFATREHGYHYANLEFLRDAAVTASWRAEPTLSVQCGAGDIFLGLDLAAHLLPRHRKQVGMWKMAGASIHVLVHDLLPALQSSWFRRRTVRNFRRWLKFIVVYCDTAVCVSAQTEQDLQAWIKLKHLAGQCRLRTSVIRLGGNIRSTGPSKGVRPEELLFLTKPKARSFVLLVGTVEPRKGHDAAIFAFEKLWACLGDDAPDLVIVGQPGWKTGRLQARLRTHSTVTSRLMWFDDASDEFLEQLYAACVGVIVPSYAEGFGLPVEEARQYGKPVLARDLPVFREPGRQSITFFKNDIDLVEVLPHWTNMIRDEVETCRKLESRNWDDTCTDLFRALRIAMPTPVENIAASQSAIAS